MLVSMSLLLSCNTNPKVEVQHSGALMNIMAGKIDATMPLNNLKELEHVYALGAIKHLKGEIQIFDGVAVNSSVVDSVVKITKDYSQSATLLVYAQVASWSEFQIPSEVSNMKQLEAFISKTALEEGFDRELPFPFLIEGSVDSLDWHIIDWDTEDTIHTHEKHQMSGLKGIVDNSPVTLIGFYSESHVGIFTHHDSNIHMHFKNKNATLAGHVDALNLGSNMTLKLPTN